jgi:TonB family protein
MKILGSLLVTICLAPSCTTLPTHETKGPSASYFYTDWGTLPPTDAFDVPPMPRDGMAAFVSRIVYPTHLRRAGTGEKFIVRVYIDATGRVLSAQVLESKQPDLQKAVIDAIRASNWFPAQKNHVPVAARFAFPVTFIPSR